MFPAQFKEVCLRDLRAFITVPQFGFAVLTNFGARLKYQINGTWKNIVLEKSEYTDLLNRFNEKELNASEVLELAAERELEEVGGMIGFVEAKIISITTNFLRRA